MGKDHDSFLRSATPKVSVVVPVYNVEKYLRQCVDSILAQTLRDIEVILVDDGSPDNCSRIIDKYAAQDLRVVAVHQSNGGYGKAVNKGIRLAKGEYVGIVESDDWIEPTMYEKLYKAAKEHDVNLAKCNFFVYNTRLAPKNQNIAWKTPTQDLMEAPDGAFSPVYDYPQIFNFHASLWSNLYKREFLLDIPFIESQGASYQDFPFIMEVLSRAGRMVVVKECLLHYRMEPGQNSSTMSGGKKTVRMADMTLKGYRVLEKLGTIENVKEYFFYHAFLANFGFFMAVDSDTRRVYLQKLHTVFESIKRDKNFSFKCFNDREKDFVVCMIKNRMPGALTLRIWKRKYLRLNIRRERIIFRIGGFEKIIPLPFERKVKTRHNI